MIINGGLRILKATFVA